MVTRLDKPDYRSIISLTTVFVMKSEPKQLFLSRLNPNPFKNPLISLLTHSQPPFSQSLPPLACYQNVVDTLNDKEIKIVAFLMFARFSQRPSRASSATKLILSHRLPNRKTFLFSFIVSAME